MIKAIDRFQADCRGLASVEFALFLPLLIVLLLGLVDVAGLLSAGRKLTSAGAAAADLTAQARSVTQAEIGNVFDAVETILAPYDALESTIVISSVSADGDGRLTLDWSEARRQAARTGIVDAPIAAGVVQPNTSVILAEVTFRYDQGLSQLFLNGLTLRERYVARPRRSTLVELR